MRSLVLLVLSAVLLGACGSGSSQPQKATTTPPPRIYTLGELELALPTMDQVSTATKKTATCPGEEYCEKGTVSVEYELRPPGDPREVEKLKNEVFGSDFVSISATPESDAKAATASIEGARKAVQKYVGAYDIPLKSSGKNYNPGEKGTGSIEDAAVAGWTGFTSSRIQQYSLRDDGSVVLNKTKYEITQLDLSDGQAVLMVYVAVVAGPRTKGASSKIALTLAEDYIKRVR